MESITKPKLTYDQLAAICNKHLCDDLASAEELNDGWFNTAFLLVSKSGREAILKSAPLDSVRLMRYEENLMHAEVSGLRLVKHLSEARVPAVIAYDKSREIVESEYFLAERIRGRPMNLIRESLSEETQFKIDRQVGAALREIHQIKGPQFGTFGRQVFTRWPDAFNSLMDWLAEDAGDIKVELPHKALQAGAPLLWSLEEVVTPTLVHWDLWDGNIFVDVEACRLTGFIDFERVLWADPLMEANFGHIRPGFLSGYGSSAMDTDAAQARRLLYDLYLYLIMVIECRFRHFTPEHETWTRGLLDKTLHQIAASALRG